MPRYLLDTDVVICLLTNEPPAHAAAARDFFQGAADGHYELLAPDNLLMELVCILERVYQVPRPRVVEYLRQLMFTPGIVFPNQDVAEDALRRYAETNAEFSDAFAAALAASRRIPIASFDHDLDQFKDITRLEPAALALKLKIA
ncbi:MAG: PIN domain-containing protein [Verrucomicrobiae bacterium]|nr:PIN domain-containing protein [Verrucomicrobiae bacterium]